MGADAVKPFLKIAEKEDKTLFVRDYAISTGRRVDPETGLNLYDF